MVEKPNPGKSLLSMLAAIGMLVILLSALIIPESVTAIPTDQTFLPYIIVFKDSVNPNAAAPEFAKAYGLQTGLIYEHALKGMAALVPPGRLIALQHDPRVAYVEPDMEHTIDMQNIPTGIERIFAYMNPEIDIDGSDDYRVDVDVAVIDTGIDFQHPDLNVMGGINCTTKIFTTVCVTGGDDDHYHGTHVAGTIGALDNDTGVVGVAPGARLWAVKVLNKRGSGYTSWIVAGIDWVTANADTIEVANMSLGGSGFSQAEYDAIQGAVNAGVAFAVAAGNEDDDANNYSPGGFDNVLSVSALADFDGLPGGYGSPTCRIDQDDTLADFSNWGPEVDIAAPGVCILSTYPLEKGEYGTISGTSMASPHVAGALALLASVNKPANASQVYNLYDQIKNSGNLNWNDDSGDDIKEPLLDVSNTMLFNPILIPGTGGGGEPNTAPVVSITSPSDGATVISGESITFSGTATDTEDGDLSGGLVWTSNLDGQIGTGGSFSAVLTSGYHTITASVMDSGGLTDTASVNITIENPLGQTITVSGLVDTSYLLNKNFWKAQALITVDPALAGAVVTTSLDGSTYSCTTDSIGTCSISTNMRTKTPTVTITINDVYLAGYSYTPSVVTITLDP